MESIDELGYFWLAANPAEGLSGRLQFTTDSGFTLSLVGRFENDEVWNTDTCPPFRIEGWVDTKRISINNCFLQSLQETSGVTRSTFHGNWALMGHHFGLSEPMFRTAFIELDLLNAWVGGSRVEENWTRPGSDPTEPFYRLTLPHSTEPASSRFGQGEVALTSRWRRVPHEHYGATVTDHAAIKVSYDEPVDRPTIMKDIGRVQSMATLCLAHPTIVERVRFHHPDIRVEMLSGEISDIPQDVEFLSARLRQARKPGTAPPRPYQMLMTYDDARGVEGIASWLDAAPEFQRALDALMSIQHREKMYMENRFLNVAHAAESFHRITIGGTQMEPIDFDALLSAYLEATPQEHRDWLRNKIGHGNEIPFIKRISQLAHRTQGLTRDLLGNRGNREKWAFAVAGVRNELTHLGTNSRMFAGADLRALADSLYTVTGAAMLMEAGVMTGTYSREFEGTEALRLEKCIARVRGVLRTPAGSPT